MDTWGQLPYHIKLELKKRLVRRDGSICSRRHGHGCGRILEWHQITMDHIIPISRGGDVCDMSNLQILCKMCHDKKTENEKRGILTRYNVRTRPTLGELLGVGKYDFCEPVLP